MARRILIQLDCDPQPSTFDAVVAVDAGAEVILRHGGVTPDNVAPLVHGAMFTRGGAELGATAIFVGGSDVAAAEAVFTRVKATFFGPLRVGVMLDPAGSNSTAAAAVVVAARHLPLADASAAGGMQALVLGGTGPVGQRVARLLARSGLAVGLASRSHDRAVEACDRIRGHVTDARLEPFEMNPRSGPFSAALERADLVVAAGAAGVMLLDGEARSRARTARVLIDLNAVPPPGIEGIAASDKGRVVGEAAVYGAIGVGGTKMRIHRAAVASLFEQPAAVLDAEEMLALGKRL
ncbi:MAG: bifunctional NADP-dependent methylenetetrahydromethanopterin dehydrogenase/methylenetetrahydrofolate dehydrogenase [Planctomycetia bacterium]|nr:bifunctional NADP-dependent methylenetetrahydromethanopterin dehydrogenase/methylenetetrahydrofolate dehydrogenase [Planctomycetia bacterium]